MLERAYSQAVIPMERYLLVEEIKDDTRTELGKLVAAEVKIGREPGPGGIALSHNAISRVHGAFIKYRSHWFYKDNGSTNGSWVNGKRAPGDSWALVRPGDLVQLADVALQLTEIDDGGQIRQSLTNFPNLGGRSLLVFKDGDFLEEFPVPEYGRALVIGGSNSDLELDGDLFELPSLVVERRGDNVGVYSIAKEIPVFVNGAETEELQNLKDSDEVRISGYFILFNDPTSARKPSTPNVQHKEVDSQASQIDLKSSLRGWESKGGGSGMSSTTTISSTSGMDLDSSGLSSTTSAKRPSSTVFGKSMAEGENLDDDTFAMDMSRGQSMHGAMRGQSLYGQTNTNGDYSLTSIEDKIILAIGFLLLIALVVLVIWWVLS